MKKTYDEVINKYYEEGIYNEGISFTYNYDLQIEKLEDDIKDNEQQLLLTDDNEEKLKIKKNLKELQQKKKELENDFNTKIKFYGSINDEGILIKSDEVIKLLNIFWD